MELRDAYLTMQANCGIEVGDKVKVLRKAKDSEMGWSGIWTTPKDEFVGNVYTVYSASDSGIKLKSYHGWALPFFVLEVVEKAKEIKLETRYFMNGKDITDTLSKETKERLNK